MASVALEKLVETRAEAGAASSSVRGMRDSSSGARQGEGVRLRLRELERL
jgi:hypothetical protein